MDIEDILTKDEFKPLQILTKELYARLDDELKRNVNNDIYYKLIEVFSNHNDDDSLKYAREWFFTKNLFFDKKRPYDLCREGKQELVYTELINIEYGNLA